MWAGLYLFFQQIFFGGGGSDLESIRSYLSFNPFIFTTWELRATNLPTDCYTIHKNILRRDGAKER